MNKQRLTLDKTCVNGKYRFLLMTSFIKKLSTPACPCMKNCCLRLITGCTILGSKICNRVFVITGNESLASLWRKFGPLFFAELFQFSSTEGVLSMSGRLRSWQSISISSGSTPKNNLMIFDDCLSPSL